MFLQLHSPVNSFNKGFALFSNVIWMVRRFLQTYGLDEHTTNTYKICAKISIAQLLRQVFWSLDASCAWSGILTEILSNIDHHPLSNLFRILVETISHQYSKQQMLMKTKVKVCLLPVCAQVSLKTWSFTLYNPINKLSLLEQIRIAWKQRETRLRKRFKKLPRKAWVIRRNTSAKFSVTSWGTGTVCSKS